MFVNFNALSNQTVNQSNRFPKSTKLFIHNLSLSYLII